MLDLLSLSVIGPVEIDVRLRAARTCTWWTECIEKFQGSPSSFLMATCTVLTGLLDRVLLCCISACLCPSHMITSEIVDTFPVPLSGKGGPKTLVPGLYLKKRGRLHQIV